MGLNDIFSSSSMLSRPTFRPRPIDVNRPLLVVHEDVGSDPLGRTVKKVGTGMEAEEEEEKHLKDALNAEAAIPIPGVKVLHLPWKEVFERTEHCYVRYSAPDEFDLDGVVEYDLMDADFTFLQDLKACNPHLSNKISETILEVVIDRLEKCVGDKRKAVAKKVALAAIRNDKRIDVSEEVFSLIYDYWSKRRRKHAQSYIPRFQNPPEANDPSPYVAFRPRDKAPYSRPRTRKNSQVSHTKLIRMLRRDFERTRLILEQVNKRERCKAEYAKATFDVFEQRVRDFKTFGEDRYPRYMEELERMRVLELERKREAERAQARVKEREKALHKPPSHAPQDKKKKKAAATPSAPHDRAERKRKAAKPLSRSRKKRKPIGGLVEDNERYFVPWRARPCLPYPRRVGDYIFLGPEVPPFRGRVRLGRCGRVIFDRWMDGAHGGSYEEVGGIGAGVARITLPRNLTGARGARGGDVTGGGRGARGGDVTGGRGGDVAGARGGDVIGGRGARGGDVTGARGGDVAGARGGDVAGGVACGGALGDGTVRLPPMSRGPSSLHHGGISTPPPPVPRPQHRIDGGTEVAGHRDAAAPARSTSTPAPADPYVLPHRWTERLKRIREAKTKSTNRPKKSSKKSTSHRRRPDANQDTFFLRMRELALM